MKLHVLCDVQEGGMSCCSRSTRGLQSCVATRGTPTDLKVTLFCSLSFGHGVSVHRVREVGEE